MAGVYHSNEFRFDGAYLYLNIVNNISQIWAMYSLIMFYRCMRDELQPLNPISKFLCVKFVIFLSFWQSVIFFILGATGVITNVEAWKSYKPSEISAIFQNVFICIEMFLAAIAHHFSFSVNPYRLDENYDKPKCCYSCLEMCDLSDVTKETIDHVKHVAKRIQTKLKSSTPGNTVGTCGPCEETSLELGIHSGSNVAHYSNLQDGDVAVGRMANILQRVKQHSKSDSSNDNSFEMSQISELSLSPIISELYESTENLVNFSSFNQSNVTSSLTK